MEPFPFRLFYLFQQCTYNVINSKWQGIAIKLSISKGQKREMFFLCPFGHILKGDLGSGFWGFWTKYSIGVFILHVWQIWKILWDSNLLI